jgi:hypothetical protein
MKKLVFSLSLFSLFLLWISLANAQYDWLLNPFFTNPALQFDKGIIRNQNVRESPDDWKWGYSCYKWDKNGVYSIDWCQVKTYYARQNDYNVHMTGDSLGTGDIINNPLIGVVKLVQGNVWGDSVPWYVPKKMPINSGDIYIDVWYDIGYFQGFLTNYMFDIWLKDDSNGNIIVLDLIFLETNPFGSKSPWWDGKVFHYQSSVCNPGNGWYHCNFKINPYIESAISAAESQGVHFHKSTMYIYQTEILFELMQGVAELEVGGFRLTTSSDCYYLDLNNDGLINIIDITKVATAFGSKSGDLNWNEEADIDKNEIIDIVDISKLAKDFGKSCS